MVLAPFRFIFVVLSWVILGGHLVSGVGAQGGNGTLVVDDRDPSLQYSPGDWEQIQSADAVVGGTFTRTRGGNVTIPFAGEHCAGFFAVEISDYSLITLMKALRFK
jgi:hypothetical protein